MIRYRKCKALTVLGVCLWTLLVYVVLTDWSVKVLTRFDPVTYGTRKNLKLCPTLRKPILVPDKQTWQMVSGGRSYDNHGRSTNQLMYVFSAFYDPSLRTFSASYSNVVRIVGVFSSETTKTFCQVWYSGDKELLIVPALLELIPEGHGRLYKACYFICNLPVGEIPYAVSLVTESCGEPLNVLPVQYNTKPEHKYTVCVTPLHLDYNNVHKLIEMVEINQMFGADYFVMYNYSIGPDVTRVLNQYESESLLEVVQWRIPMKVDTWPQTSGVEIHYFGQLAALNDCLFRHRSSEYVVFLDLDELIVPRVDNNWDEMIWRIEMKGKLDVMTFRCTFFRTEYPDTEEDFPDRQTAEKYKLETLLKVDREAKILPPYSRSKFIVKPQQIITVGIHNVWLRLQEATEAAVEPSVGLLHHYRSWNGLSDEKVLKDLNFHRFSADIAEKVRQRWQQIAYPS